MAENGSHEQKHYFLNGKSVYKSQVAEEDQTSSSEVSAALNAMDLAGGSCIRIFVAGAVTHVGKTTVCLSILGALRKAGIKASELGYIKPATQCEAPDLLSHWCKEQGIEYVSGENAPLVFYSGFTRSFLEGDQGTSAQWLEKIGTRVDQMAVGKRALIVDGVGFPGVGSVVGVDNADVAKATRAPVLLVCKSGVGGAIDSYSLNSSYFLAKGVPVLGAIFNFGAVDGFYSWDKCAESIKVWFNQGGRRERYFGVVPLTPELDGLRERISETNDVQLNEFAELNAMHFAKYVDLHGILDGAAADPWNRSAASHQAGAEPKVPKRQAPTSAEFLPASRDKIVKAAKESGAKGGG